MKLHFQCTVGNLFQDCDVTMWPSTFIHISWKHAALKLVVVINSSMLLTFQFFSVHIYMYRHIKCIYICARVCVRTRVCVCISFAWCLCIVSMYLVNCGALIGLNQPLYKCA